MAVDNVVGLRLDTLYCHREDDGLFGSAEPYLWSAPASHRGSGSSS
jgi:hypothetical protein